LEASRASIASASLDVGSADADLVAAMESLRHAIAELHARAGERSPSRLAFGFVLSEADAPKLD
jgi:hypothetical protein